MGLSEWIGKKLARQRAKARQAGQAVLEYILILFIVVSIILGILYQFNDAFKQFLDNYFGDYIACLLETGELPSLGGQGPTSGECRSPIQDFAISAGKKLYEGGSGGSSGSGDGGSGGSSSNRDSSDSSSSSSSSGSSNLRSARVTGSGGTPNADSASRQGQGLRQSRVPLKNPSDGDGTKSDFSGGDGSLGLGRRGRVVRRKRVIYLGDEYLTEDQKKKKEAAAAAVPKKKKKGDEGEKLRPPVVKIEKPKGYRDVAEEKGFRFGMGDFIKFLLIAGILIALFIFLGGQAAQIKKGWQKSE